MKVFGIILMAAFLVSTTELHAETKKEPGNTVIDFEADLIEGERRKPDIFLQLGTQQPTMDSVIYSRQDFNDFHRRDKNWRPGYDEQAPQPPKKAKK